MSTTSAFAIAWLRSSPPRRPGRPRGTKRSTRPNPKHASRLAFAFDDGSAPQVALHASSLTARAHVSWLTRPFRRFAQQPM
jgi:hypothetical protein